MKKKIKIQNSFVWTKKPTVRANKTGIIFMIFILICVENLAEINRFESHTEKKQTVFFANYNFLKQYQSILSA